MACIYVVEDDTDIREIETIALRNSGHLVSDFENGKAFYKKTEERAIRELTNWRIKYKIF